MDDLFKTINPICLQLVEQPNCAKIKQLYLILSSQVHVLRNNTKSNDVKASLLINAEHAEVFIDPRLAGYLFSIVTKLLNTGFNNDLKANINDKSEDINIDKNHEEYEYIFKIIRILIDYSYKYQFNVLLIKMFPIIPYILSSNTNAIIADNNKELNVKYPEFTKAVLQCSLALLEAVNKNNESKRLSSTCQNSMSHFINLNLSNIVTSPDIESSIVSVSILRVIIFHIINDLRLCILIFPGVVSKLLKLIITDIGSIKKNKVAKYVEILKFLRKYLTYCLNSKNSAVLDKQTVSNINENLNVFFENLLKKIANRSAAVTFSSQIRIEILELINNNLLSSCHNNLSKENILTISKISIFLTSNNPELQTIYKLPNSSLYDTTILSLVGKENSSLLYSANQLEITLKVNAICVNLKNCSLNDESSTKNFQNQNYKEIELKTFEFIQQIIEELIILYNNNMKKKVNLKNSKSSLKISDLEHILDDSSTLNTLVKDKSFLIGSKFKRKTNNNNKVSFEANLSLLSRRDYISSELGSNSNFISKNDLRIFQGIFDYEVEVSLINLFKQIGKISNHKFNLNFLQMTLLNQGNSNLSKSLSLWICNCIVEGIIEVKAGKEQQRDEVDEFLQFDDDSDDGSINNNNNDDLMATENILDMLEVSNTLLSLRDSDNDSQLIASISLDTIAIASQFLKNDFEQELMDYLFPVIEKLTTSSIYSSSVVFKHCENALTEISKNVYNDRSGNLSTIILNNSDYILDNVNLKLMNGALIPETLQILIVLIKISGVNIINHMGDVINSSFILLDMYNEYSALSNGIFAIFSEILSSIYDKYLKDQFDFEKLIFEVHLKEIRNYEKPWNIQSSEQMFNLLDHTKKDISDVIEDKRREDESQEVDSDDEDSDDNTQIDIHEDKIDDIFKYKSHIPKNLYLMVQQIVSYSIRFIQYESFALKNKIFNIINKAIMILCTQLTELNPVLYQLWPLISDLATKEQDIKINIMALDTLFVMFKFGGSFLNKNFIRLWKSLINDNKNFQSYSKRLLFAKQRVKNNRSLKVKDEFKHTLEIEYFENINKLLLLILNNNLGSSASIVLTKQIIDIGCDIDMDNLDEQFGINSDIAWYLMN